MKFTKKEIKESMLLYAITDRTWLKEDESLVSVCKQVIENGASFLQLREKGLDEELVLQEAVKLQELCQNYNVPFVVNDNVDIAIKMNADGVHVGRDDIKGRDIRKLIGNDKILGMTAHNVSEAVEAESLGADYIGVGAVFSTNTKKNTVALPLDELKKICDTVNIPVVAIGGINKDNIIKLSGSNIDGVAVISALFATDNYASATKNILDLSKKIVSTK